MLGGIETSADVCYNAFTMKTAAKWFSILMIASFAVIALADDQTNKAASVKIKEDAKAATEKTKDTVKDVVEVSKQKAVVVATNVTTGVKEGLHKAGDVATNVVSKVKEGAHAVGELTTNVIGEVKETIKKIKD